MNEIYIHLGLPRTGTTFLQQNVFPKLNLFHPRVPDSLNMPKFIDYSNVDGKVLLSNENWSGWLYKETAYERYAILEYFKNKYPYAHVMLCTREKESWLKSCKNNQWKKEPNYDLEAYDKEMLDIDEYVKKIREMFDDVFIYRFEDFKNDNRLWVRNICEWIGVDVPPNINYKVVNQSWNKQQVMLAHWIKKLKKYGFERILGGI